MNSQSTMHNVNVVWKRSTQRFAASCVCSVMLSSCATHQDAVAPVTTTNTVQPVEAIPVMPESSGQSKASMCKAINVKVRNLTGREIDIVGVEFYSYANRRWHPVSIDEVSVSGGKGWNHNLELQGFNGIKTKAKINYRVKPGGKSVNKEATLKTGETKAKNCQKITGFFKTVR